MLPPALSPPTTSGEESSSPATQLSASKQSSTRHRERMLGRHAVVDADHGRRGAGGQHPAHRVRGFDPVHHPAAAVQPDDRSVRAVRAVAAAGDLGAADRYRKLLDLIDGRALADQLGDRRHGDTNLGRAELVDPRLAGVPDLLEKRLGLRIKLHSALRSVAGPVPATPGGGVDAAGLYPESGRAPLPVAAVDDLVERPPVDLGQRRERAVGRVAHRDQVGAQVVVREAEQARGRDPDRRPPNGPCRCRDRPRRS